VVLVLLVLDEEPLLDVLLEDDVLDEVVVDALGTVLDVELALEADELLELLVDVVLGAEVELVLDVGPIYPIPLSALLWAVPAKTATILIIKSLLKYLAISSPHLFKINIDCVFIKNIASIIIFVK